MQYNNNTETCQFNSTEDIVISRADDTSEDVNAADRKMYIASNFEREAKRQRISREGKRERVGKNVQKTKSNGKNQDNIYIDKNLTKYEFEHSFRAGNGSTTARASNAIGIHEIILFIFHPGSCAENIEFLFLFFVSASDGAHRRRTPYVVAEHTSLYIYI